MGRHEEVSCQCEVRGWNACAHGRGEKRWERGRDVKKGQCDPIYITSGKTLSIQSLSFVYSHNNS